MGRGQGACAIMARVERRASRNSRMRQVNVAAKCSVCAEQLKGEGDMRSHIKLSMTCDLRNFIRIKNCYIRVKEGHGEVEAEEETSGQEEAAVEGHITKELYMEAVGLELRGIITMEEEEEEKEEEEEESRWWEEDHIVGGWRPEEGWRSWVVSGWPPSSLIHSLRACFTLRSA